MADSKLNRLSKDIVFLLLILLFRINCIGQEIEYKFHPKWKVGDQKNVTIHQHETTFTNGKQTEDTTYIFTTEFTVLKETTDHFILKVLKENIALRNVVHFYENLDEDLKNYKNLSLEYQIDKNTGKAELINWKEAQKFMIESIDQINKLIEKKAPEMKEVTEFTLAPIYESFKNKDHIESYMRNDMDYLLFPYDKTFKIGDTLSIKNLCANPFSPKDTITQTTLAYLSKIDETTKICDFNITEIYDLTEFKNVMKAMMKKITKSEDTEQIDNINFDGTNIILITFDYNTTWPLKVTKYGKVIAIDPRRKTEKIITQTITLK